MPKKIQDSEMVGRVFGRLTVIKRSGASDMWECCCSCGKNSEVLVKRGKLQRYDKLLVELSGDTEGINKALGLTNVMS